MIDLRAWTEVIQSVSLESRFSAWAILPVILNHQNDPTGEVVLVDLHQAKMVARQSLNAVILKAAFTPVGSLALYGIQNVKEGSDSDAYLALFDGKDLHLLWEKTLPEVRFATEGVGGASEGKDLNPAAVFTDDGSLLYIVAADQPTLVKVDFAQQSVRSFQIERRASLLDHLMQLTASVVYAKSMNSISKDGVLSADGKYFYVVGQETKMATNAQGDEEEEITPLGLQIIDTRDGTLTYTLPTDANSIRLSMDGKSLLLAGFEQLKDGAEHPWTDIVDTQSWKVTQHLSGIAYPSRLLNGEFAWLVVEHNHDNSYTLVIYNDGETAPGSQVDGSEYADWIPIP